MGELVDARARWVPVTVEHRFAMGAWRDDARLDDLVNRIGPVAVNQF
jgi:hypothetical protein